MQRRFPAAACLLLAACTSGPGGGEEVAFALPADAAPGTYWQGDHSQSTERVYVTARTDREWRELWARVGGEPPSALPGGQMAVAVFLGTRDTGGYGVSIERVARDGGETVVAYRERVPGPASPVVQVLTSPYAVRLVPEAAGAPSFRRAG